MSKMIILIAIPMLCGTLIGYGAGKGLTRVWVTAVLIWLLDVVYINLQSRGV